MMLMRPMWIEGESWPGFLLRIAEENSLKGLNGIGRVIGLSVGELICVEPRIALMKLGYQSTLNFPTPTRWHLADQKSKFIGSSGRSFYSRVCSKCLRTDSKPFIRASWDQALAIFCPIHFERLAETCTYCLEPINFYRHKIISCCCGFSFIQPKRKESNLDISTILQAFSLQYINDGCKGTFEGSTRKEHLAALALLKIYIRIREIQGDKLIPKRITLANSFLDTKKIEALLPVFYDWPNQFINIVEEVYCISGKSHFGLLNSSTLYASEFKEIKTALDERICRRRQSKSRRLSTSGKSIQSNVRQDLIGISELMDLTGLHYTRLMPWVKDGKFGSTVSVVELNGTISEKFLRARVQPLLNFLSVTTTINSAGKDIGLEPIVMRYMVRDQILKSFSLGGVDYTNRLAVSDVYLWANSIFLWASRSRTSSREYINFSSASAAVLRRNRVGFKHYMESIGTKSLPLKYFGIKPIALNEVFLFKDDVERWILKAQDALRKNANN